MFFILSADIGAFAIYSVIFKCLDIYWHKSFNNNLNKKTCAIDEDKTSSRI